jgi:uncharacterized membrane protein
MEAFSDGVIAILITIMVLELKIPHGEDWAALRPLFPIFLSYILSFIYLGIYWNNHHHLLQAARRVNGRVLWSNLHLLFWLSLIPFVTGWMGENSFSALPLAFYGGVLFMAGLAYYILAQALIALHGQDSTLAKAIGRGFKEWLSLILYVVAISISFVTSSGAFAIYCLVALIWFIPDRRIERNLGDGLE